MASSGPGSGHVKGRGAGSNPEGRFESQRREVFHDGWDLPVEELPSLQTTVRPETARTIIARNDSPDIMFEQSINPYRGCEHGCIYCYARPSHAYLNLSPGLDFDTQLFYKPDAAALLDAELRKRSYTPKLIALGSNTDPYQPIEREYRVTRSILEKLLEFRHPVAIVTKGVLIERDIDLLTELARLNLVMVGITLTTMRDDLKRDLEPRAASTGARLRVMRQIAAAGVPLHVLFSPVIPFVNDHELEAVLEAAAEAGAQSASYALLRLPHEVKDLFREWLAQRYPLKAEHVMSLVQQARSGRDYDSRFGKRMTGEGQYAGLIAQRFALAKRRFGLTADRAALDQGLFRVPAAGGQQPLF
jgi:DNA repair photolyase